MLNIKLFRKMKKYWLIFFCFALIIGCKNQQEEKIEIKEYNDKMIAIQSSVDRSVVSLIGAINSFEKDLMEEALKRAILTTETAIENFNGQKIENEKLNTFNTEMESLLKAYRSIINNEFYEIVEIYSLPDEEYAKEHENLISDLFDEALKQYSIALAGFKDFQEAFAERHGLVLTD